MNLEKLAQRYFDEVRKNEFSRLRAWEFIYAYTRVDDLGILVDEEHIEKTGLHLGLYLAQWGMFRGSGHLIDQNLNYFMWMSKFYFKEIPNQFPDFYKHEFSDFMDDDFCKQFDEVIRFIRHEKLMMNPSDTLISKTLLGIWGHVPALDRQFKQSVKVIFEENANLPNRLNSRSMRLLNIYFATEGRSYKLNSSLYKFYFGKDEIKYTEAKLLDMIFWIKNY